MPVEETELSITAAESPVAAIITAAGSGARLGFSVPKALVKCQMLSLVARAALQAARSGVVKFLVISAPATQVATVSADIRRTLAGAGLAMPITVVPGGASRQASVAAALAVVEDAVESGLEIKAVLVHDAARALTPPALFQRVAAQVLNGHGAVVPGIPVADTIKIVDFPPSCTADKKTTTAQTGGEQKIGAQSESPLRVLNTPPRANLRAIQTPQGFSLSLLSAVHTQYAAHAKQESTAFTDDAAMVEASGKTVMVISGEELAFKITTRRDLEYAEQILATQNHKAVGQVANNSSVVNAEGKTKSSM